MFCPYDCNNLIRIENYLIFALDYGPIVQGIEQKFPKLQIQVRVLVGLLSETTCSDDKLSLLFVPTPF